MPKVTPDYGDEQQLDNKDFVCDEITGLELYSYADRVKERFSEIVGEQRVRPQLMEQHRGIFPGLQPGDYFNGRLPVVVRQLNIDQLSALYSLFTSWYSYLVYQTSLIAIKMSSQAQKKEFLWSFIRKKYKGSSKTEKISEQLASDKTRGDYRFIKEDSDYEELKVLYQCLQSTLEVAKQDMRMISREVTINQVKMEREAMEATMSNKDRLFVNRFNRPQEGAGNESSINKVAAQPRAFRRP